MPIIPSITTRRISQKEFGALAYEVMDHVFAIHGDFGRFFDDVIVHDGGLFEFKAADAIHSKHRGQTIHYLLLFDLAHEKLINVRTEEVRHEFANCHRRLANLRNPTIIDKAWDRNTIGAEAFRDTLTTLVHDWGTGLDIALYEEGLEHFFITAQSLNPTVPVFGNSGHLADQRMRLVTPEVAFKLTALTEPLDNLHTNARKLLRHTPLKAIHWANLTHDEITLTTIHP